MLGRQCENFGGGWLERGMRRIVGRHPVALQSDDHKSDFAAQVQSPRPAVPEPVGKPQTDPHTTEQSSPSSHTPTAVHSHDVSHVEARAKEQSVYPTVKEPLGKAETVPPVAEKSSFPSPIAMEKPDPFDTEYWHERASLADGDPEQLQALVTDLTSVVSEYWGEYIKLDNDYTPLHTHLAQKVESIASLESTVAITEKEKLERESVLEKERELARNLRKAIHSINLLANLRAFAGIAREGITPVIKNDLPLDAATMKTMDVDKLAEKTGELVDEEDVDYSPDDIPSLVCSLQLMSQELNQFLHGFRPTIFEFSFSYWVKKVIPLTSPDISDKTRQWVLQTLKPAMEAIYNDRMVEHTKKWDKLSTRAMQESGNVVAGLRHVPTSFSHSMILNIPNVLTTMSKLPKELNITQGQHVWVSKQDDDDDDE